jgi:hypothetical protein
MEIVTIVLIGIKLIGLQQPLNLLILFSLLKPRDLIMDTLVLRKEELTDLDTLVLRKEELTDLEYRILIDIDEDFEIAVKKMISFYKENNSDYMDPMVVRFFNSDLELTNCILDDITLAELYGHFKTYLGVTDNKASPVSKISFAKTIERLGAKRVKLSGNINAFRFVKLVEEITEDEEWEL